MLEAGRTGGHPAALYVEGDGCSLLAPLVLNGGRVGGQGPEVVDAISPYGYPGFLVDAEGQERSFVQDALGASIPVLAEAGVTSVFLRLDPLRNNPANLEGLGTLVEHGACVYVDLALPEEELQRQVRGRFRSYIRAMGREGVTAGFDDEFENFDTFIDFYYRTMDAVGAASMYYFKPSYFSGLREVLGRDLKLCIVEYEGRAVAAGLFAVSGGVVQYLLSGKEEGGGHPHATKLMMVHVRDWAKEQGLKVLHLAGGVGGRSDDALSRFKRGFSKLSKPFYSWRLIAHQGRFAEAVADWERMSGESVGDVRGFFPPYRQAIADGRKIEGSQDTKERG